MIPYGLSAQAPDLLLSSPSLAKLKKHCPGYVSRAEKAQAYARRVARKIIEPAALRLDKEAARDTAYVDWDLWKQLNAAKTSICMVPEALGGLGWGFLDIFAALEEFVAADVSTTAFFMFNLFGPVCAFVEFRPDICLSLIRDLVEAQERGEPLFFAWALTEPACGTDNLNEQALKTQRPTMAVDRVEGGYRLNGTKHFISNGSLAHRLLVILPTEADRPYETFSCMFVPADSPGFSVGRIERKMGHKAKHTAELVFKDVFVPDANVWERPGRGWRHTMEILATSTGAVGMLGVGMARGSLERCIQYCKKKKFQGRPIIEQNWVQIAIADMHQKIMAVRAKALDFAMGADAQLVTSILDKPAVKAGLWGLPKNLLLGDSLLALSQNPALAERVSAYKHKCVPDEAVARFKAQGAALKVAGTDLAVEVSARVLDIVGLPGAAHAHGMEKIFRDAKVSQIYEGTNQVNLLSLFDAHIGQGGAS